MRTDRRPRNRLSCILFAVAMLSVCSFSISGQTQPWTVNGNNISNTNSGNVGIGTASPSEALHIINATGGVGQVQLQGGTSSAGFVGYWNEGGLFLSSNRNIRTGNNFNATFGGSQLVLGNAGDGNRGDISFQTTGSGTSGTLSNLVRIKASGNVGIGTVSPATKLDVVGIIRGGNSDTNIGNHPLYGNSYTAFWRQGADYSLLTNGTDTLVNAPAGTGNIYFRNANTDKMVLLGSSGFLGIGTPTPSFRLDVQGGSINTSQGLCIAGVCKTSWSQVGGSQWTTTGTTINYTTGNVGIATATPTEKLHVTGNVKIVGDIDVSGNIKAKYQDVAEWVETSQELPAGTVVVLDTGRNNQVIASQQSYDSRVAGVISAKPGLALGEAGEGRVLVATTGRVKIKVDATNGPIQIGDLLVTSDKEGFAMKSVPVDIAGVRMHRPGTLIGKALEPLASGVGEILVLLSLQ